MSIAVWKFPLKMLDTQTVDMPRGAAIRCAQFQLEQLCLWASVDVDAENEKRSFVIVGTGHIIPAWKNAFLHYIGTVQLHGGSLVFHVFEDVRT